MAIIGREMKLRHIINGIEVQEDELKNFTIQGEHINRIFDALNERVQKTTVIENKGAEVLKEGISQQEHQSDNESGLVAEVTL